MKRSLKVTNPKSYSNKVNPDNVVFIVLSSKQLCDGVKDLKILNFLIKTL